MSRTLRKEFDKTIQDKDGRNQTESKWPSTNKLRPYLSDKNRGVGKFRVEHSSGKLGISKTGKLVTKNANRSLKKAKRQQDRKEIKNELS